MIYGIGKMVCSEWEYEGEFVNGEMKGQGKLVEKKG